jgi:phospholipid/cholesterol/gamma-HCH transport system permease protein
MIATEPGFNAPTAGDAQRPRRMTRVAGTVFQEHLRQGLVGLGGAATFALLTIRALPAVFLHKERRRELVTQLDTLAVGALPITHLTGLIAGLLLGVQTRVALREFGITTMFPAMLTIALVRELGPTFVSLVAGARAGSGIASELATMAVTQQVDAMRALRRDPIATLAAPRTLACIIGFPALATAGILAGLVGGMMVGLDLQQTPSFFFHQSLASLGIREIIPNLIVKPALFGLLIGTTSSYLGLAAEGGTRSVGNATVRSVVIVTVGVLVADYLVSETFRRFWPPPPF